MNWSIGEAKSLSIKAARGIGFQWGLAEEAGSAVAKLEKNGLPGIECLAQYLTDIENQNNEKANYKLDEILCPIKMGSIVSDTQNIDFIDKKIIYQPLLITPFLDNTSINKGQVFVYNNCVFKILNHHIINNDNNEDIILKHAYCNIEINTLNYNKIIFKSRVKKNNARFIKTLEKFAFRTYAPSTEESRAKGAGSNLDDNE